MWQGPRNHRDGAFVLPTGKTKRNGRTRYSTHEKSAPRLFHAVHLAKLPPCPPIKAATTRDNAENPSSASAFALARDSVSTFDTCTPVLEQRGWIFREGLVKSFQKSAGPLHAARNKTWQQADAVSIGVTWLSIGLHIQ